jgi:hypothetical protein
MKINVSLFFLFFLLITGCNPVSTIRVTMAPRTLKTLTSSESWQFSNESEYEFNNRYIEISNNKAKLRPVTTTFNTDFSFNTGTHSGTFATNNILTIPSKGAANPSVNTIVPEAASNLEAYYRMETDTSDSSGNARNATLSTGLMRIMKTWLGTGAAELNGDSSFVIDPAAKLEPKNISVSVWFRTSLRQAATSNATQTILAASMGAHPTNNSFFVGVNNSVSPTLGSIFVNVDGVNLPFKFVESSNVVPVNQWAHLFVTYDGFTIKCYLNGEEIINTPYAGGDNQYIADSTKWLIGRRWAEGAPLYNPKYLDGSIDELAIWNKALTQAQAKKIFQEQSQGQFNFLTSPWAPQLSNLVGYWNLDGTLNDSGPNKYKITPGTTNDFSTIDPKVGSATGLKTTSTATMMNVGNVTQLNSTAKFTISGWYKFNFFDDAKIIWSKNSSTTNNIRMILNGTAGDLLIGVANGATANSSVKTTSNLLKTNTWYYLSVVYDGTQSSDSFRISLYVNGQPTTLVSEIAGIPATTGTNTTVLSFGQFRGSYDDFAIWNTALTQEEIISIYDRHQQPISASFDSPIIDMGTNVAWPVLDTKTSMPFYKELPVQTENTADYSNSPSNFSNMLKGLWQFNETIGTTITDTSGNGNAISFNGSTLVGTPGRMGSSVYLDGVSSYGETSSSPSLANPFSICTWINTDEAPAAGTMVLEKGGCSTNDGFGLELNNASSSKYSFVLWGGGAGTCSASCRNSSTSNIIPAKWNFICGTYDGTTSKIYVNGKYENSATCPISMNSQLITVGASTAKDHFFKGHIDETALWSRSLPDNQIQELYRRGANRVKYQVRSCTQLNCSDAIWRGPDGLSTSYFSELHNNDVINATNGMPEGNILAQSLYLTFLDFTPLARPANNRYFQFRAFLESDDNNNLCSGLPCMPEIQSFSLGQPSEYYYGVSTVISKNAISVPNLQKISIVSNRDCARFQLSKDNGVTWSWWDGTNWSTATDTIANANAISDLNQEILSAFEATSYKFKAYLPAANDFSQGCELRSVNLIY